MNETNYEDGNDQPQANEPNSEDGNDQPEVNEPNHKDELSEDSDFCKDNEEYEKLD